MNMKIAQFRAETLKLNRHVDLRASLTLFAMALGFMLSNPALGADGKEYPGTMCQHFNPGVAPNGKIVYPTYGGVFNINTNGVHLTCPLVRDAERKTARIIYAAVTVEKPSSDSSVGCRLDSTAYFGGAGWVTSASDSSTATGLRLIVLPVKADTFVSGSFTISCFVPPGGGIHHYGIVEAE